MRRILFLGQKPLGENCFQQLLSFSESNLKICAVVSNAPEQTVWWNSAEIHKIARAREIPFLSNESRNEDKILEAIRSYSIDTILSVQHAWILSSQLLAAVGGQAFNVHSAKLPEYKGYNSCNHAILNGETVFASTVHWMSENVDMGNIAYEETFDIASDETARSLYMKAEQASMKGFEKLVSCLAAGQTPPATPMCGKGHYYSRKSIEGLREINVQLSDTDLDRRVRGLFFPPFEPAYKWVGSKKIYLLPGNFREYKKLF